jgi:hypothetical protein
MDRNSSRLEDKLVLFTLTLYKVPYLLSQFLNVKQYQGPNNELNQNEVFDNHQNVGQRLAYCEEKPRQDLPTKIDN